VQRVERPSSDGRFVVPPARVRLLAVVLIVALMSLSAYVGCRQLSATPPGPRPGDRIESVEKIRAYLERVERALRSVDDTLFPDEPASEKHP
jgi:hypothetical protein